MKKIIALVFALVCLLAGCASDYTAPSATDTSLLPTQATPAPQGLQLLSHAVEGGCYVIDENSSQPFLQYVDYTDRTVRSICRKEGCQHYADDCDAYPPEAAFFADNDLLFGLAGSPAHDGGTILCMNTDGTNRRTIDFSFAPFTDQDSAFDSMTFDTSFLARDGDTLYINVWKSSPLTEQESAGSVGDSTYCELHQVSISTGESRAVCTLPNDYLSVLGIFEGKLLITSMLGAPANDLGILYQTVDLKTGEIETLAETLFSDLQNDYASFSNGFYQDGLLYYLITVTDSSPMVSALDLATLEPVFVSEVPGLWCLEEEQSHETSPTIVAKVGQHLIYEFYRYSATNDALCLTRCAVNLQDFTANALSFVTLSPAYYAKPDTYEPAPIVILDANDEFLLVVAEHRHQITAGTADQTPYHINQTAVYSLISTDDFFSNTEHFLSIVPVD